MILRSIIVCGSRDGAPFGEVERGMNAAIEAPARCEIPTFDHIVVGSDRGVDIRAFQWALKRELPATIVPAKWEELGKRAGPERNRRMLALFRPVAVLAFAGGRGTEDMCSAAKTAQVSVWRWLGRDGWRIDVGS